VFIALIASIHGLEQVTSQHLLKFTLSVLAMKTFAC